MSAAYGIYDYDTHDFKRRGKHRERNKKSAEVIFNNHYLDQETEDRLFRQTVEADHELALCLNQTPKERLTSNPPENRWGDEIKEDFIHYCATLKSNQEAFLKLGMSESTFKKLASLWEVDTPSMRNKKRRKHLGSPTEGRNGRLKK